MERTDKIRQVLQNKGRQVWSIAPSATIYQALALMAEKNIGAVLVMSDQKLVGILSERDYARKVILKGKSSKQTRVEEIMTSEVIVVTPDHTIDECMRRMTDGRLRHLPVVEGENVIGLVSIGDLVNWIITAQQESLEQLKGYIAGRYPG